MTLLKEKPKGISFSIDSLLNSDDDKKYKEVGKEDRALSDATVSPSALIRSAVAPMLPDDGNLRVDEELSECSDTSLRLSGARHSGSSTPISDLSDLNSTPPPDSSLDHTETPILTRKKKARTAFTQQQVDDLERRYESQRYLSATERGDLAEELGLSDQQVKTWFQNRRMKEKRQRHEKNDGPAFPTGGVDVAQLRALGIPCPLPPGSAPQFSSGAMHHGHQLPVSPYGSMYTPAGYPAVPGQRLSGIPMYNPYGYHFPHGLPLPMPAFGPVM